MRKTLDGLTQDKSPFVNPPQGAEGRRAHWVKPELVAQIAFTEWTQDDILRNSSFQGLRDDKRARDVVREKLGGMPKLAPVPAEADLAQRNGTKTTLAKAN